MEICSQCRDAVMYCSCSRTDPEMSSHPEWSENPSFWIYRGNAKVEWDRDGRVLSGDQDLIAEIKSKLSGEYEEVLVPGFCLWMVPQDPYAVHLVAQQIKGCTFSPSAPDWSKFSESGVIY